MNEINKLGEEQINSQGYLMRIIEYNDDDDLVIEFQDKYRAKVHTKYGLFESSNVKNPYHPTIFGVAIVGNKYPTRKHGKYIKEYETWTGMLDRCFNDKLKEKYPTYHNVTCCEEWLLYENFYEWIHSQSNYDKWLVGKKWEMDKDIICNGNKTYSPDSCFLVPNYVNVLFTKSSAARGKLPIGVCYSGKNKDRYTSKVSIRINDGKKRESGRIRKSLGYFNTPEEAFLAYKKAKEEHIKEVAQEEYESGNITKECCEAMMKYEVKITD